MVGIVIICHSKALAQAIVELAQQMVKTSVPIAIAAGIDDPEYPFGTDPLAIKQAIDSIYTDEGVKQELQKEGIAFDPKMPVGVMIEVPGAVTMADKIAPEVNFFSLGTNDLSQYMMAADRTNTKVAQLADGFEPAVLRMVAQTVKIGHEQGIKVSVCGQIASDSQAVPILIGLGASELSVNPPSIGRVKEVISGLNLEEAKDLAAQVLELDSAQAVKDFIKINFKNVGCVL